MRLNKKQSGLLRVKLEEVMSARDLLTDTVNDLIATINDIDARLMTAPRPVKITDDRPPIRAHINPKRYANRHVEVNGGVRGAVAESMRRAIAEEAAQYLMSDTSPGMRTRDLAQFVPTLRERYTTMGRQIAGLSGILTSLGPHFHVHNVSGDKRARWVYKR